MWLLQCVPHSASAIQVADWRAGFYQVKEIIISADG